MKANRKIVAAAKAQVEKQGFKRVVRKVQAPC